MPGFRRGEVDFGAVKSVHNLERAKSRRSFTKHALAKHSRNFSPRGIMRGGIRL
jgi:hypothetical protein